MESALRQGQTKIPDTLKRGHLKEGVPAIMACVATPQQFKDNPSAEEIVFQEIRSKVPGMHNVKHDGSPEELRAQNFKNPGINSYVISPIDGLNKFSKSFVNCTGLVVAGYDKKTSENISFLSHQYPRYFLGNENKQNRFVADLEERLTELKERCQKGTIDAKIIGGNYLKAQDFEPHDLQDFEIEVYQKSYLASIKLLSDEIEKVLGFEPVMITGPKLIPGEEDIFYENKNRRLYISRPEVGDNSTKSFVLSTINEQKEKW